ncbi:transposase [Rothia nasimurium]|uniref:transposase n=1 Tax=Rothia nasimurium TaxID=85336 RepID=UPI003C6DE53D
METEQQIPDLVEAHHLSAIIRSIPGVGVRTSARILTEVVGKDFKDASHLFSYAEIASVDRNRVPQIRVLTSHSLRTKYSSECFSYLLLLR